MLGSRVGIFYYKPNDSFPTQISNLQAWYDGKDNTTIKNAANTNAVNDDQVATWQDKSGNNYHLTSSSSIRRPTYKASELNSLPSIYFNGASNDIGNTGYGVNTQNFSIISVHNQTGSNGPVWDVAKGSLYEKFFANYNSIYTTSEIELGNMATNWAMVTPGLPFSINFICVAIYNATTSNVKLIVYDAVNGTRTLINTTFTSNLTFNGGFSLGSRLLSSFNDHFKGYIKEVIVYNKTISSTDSDNLITYLRSKWNI